jgi:hypothetical protein
VREIELAVWSEVQKSPQVEVLHGSRNRQEERINDGIASWRVGSRSAVLFVSVERRWRLPMLELEPASRAKFRSRFEAGSSETGLAG